MQRAAGSGSGGGKRWARGREGEGAVERERESERKRRGDKEVDQIGLDWTGAGNQCEWSVGEFPKRRREGASLSPSPSVIHGISLVERQNNWGPVVVERPESRRFFHRAGFVREIHD